MIQLGHELIFDFIYLMDLFPAHLADKSENSSKMLPFFGPYIGPFFGSYFAVWAALLFPIPWARVGGGSLNLHILAMLKIPLNKQLEGT